MMLCDYHTHTTFSDGKNTPEEMIISAINKNMSEIGISDHSYTSFDDSYCIKKDKIEEYKSTIFVLKEKYKDKIKVLCGIEQDYYSTEPATDYDYIIGSVHYIKVDDSYIPVDESANITKNAIQKYFGGDANAFAEEYFKTVSDIVNRTKADIIGHFDLLTKFNEEVKIFDITNERYINAWKSAVDNLLKYNKPFEINTGAISRGYRTSPYPNSDILDYIIKNGGKTINSSDSHSADTICYKFDKL